MKGRVLSLYLTSCSIVSMHAADLGNMHLVRQLLTQYAARSSAEYQTLKDLKMADIETPLLDDIKSLRQAASYTQSSTLKGFGVKAYGQQAHYNAALLTHLRAHLETSTPLPAVISHLIAEYLQPGWALAKVIQNGPGIVSRLGWDEDHVVISTEDIKGEAAPRYELWDIDTEKIINPSIRPKRTMRAIPFGFGSDIRLETLLDFDETNDHKRRIVSDIKKGLILWDWSEGIPLVGVERLGKFKYIPADPLPGNSDLLNTYLTAGFSPDGKYIIAGQLDGSLTLFNATNGQRAYVLSHPDSVTTCIVSNNRVITGLANGNVVVWRGEFGDQHPLPVEAQAPASSIEVKQALNEKPEPMRMVDAPPPSERDLCLDYRLRCQGDCILCKNLCIAFCKLGYSFLSNGIRCCSHTPGCCIESCQICRQELLRR